MDAMSGSNAEICSIINDNKSTHYYTLYSIKECMNGCITENVSGHCMVTDIYLLYIYRRWHYTPVWVEKMCTLDIFMILIIRIF